MSNQNLHGVELVASILILKLVLDHMEHVGTRYIGCCILLTYDCILAAAKIVALQTRPSCYSVCSSYQLSKPDMAY